MDEQRCFPGCLLGDGEKRCRFLALGQTKNTPIGHHADDLDGLAGVVN
jgi:hypothetical protein